MGSFSKAPPWMILVVLVLIFILLLISYREGKPIGYKITKEEAHFGFIDVVKPVPVIPSPAKVVKWHGYYNYFKDENNPDGSFITETAYEPMRLEYWDNYNFSASSESEFVIQGKKEVRKWKQSGYDIGSRIVISYITLSDKPKGAGIYFLKEDHGTYIGSWQGVDCFKKAIIRCPYVLSDEEMDVSAAKQKWKVIFDEQCKVVSEDPGMLCN